MLVLTRKSGESITLTIPAGEPVEIEITSLGEHLAKIGIDAPPAIKILRTELRKTDATQLE